MNEELSYPCPNCDAEIVIEEPEEETFLVCLNCCEVCRIHALANTRARLGRMGECLYCLEPATDLEIAAWWRGFQEKHRKGE